MISVTTKRKYIVILFAMEMENAVLLNDLMLGERTLLLDIKVLYVVTS